MIVFFSLITHFLSLLHVSCSASIHSPPSQFLKDFTCSWNEREGGRVKRYAIEGTYYMSPTITYRIRSYSRRMGHDAVRYSLRRAFEVWSEHTNLVFHLIHSGRANLNIHFVTGSHGDEEPFDGPGDILAHAFFPRFGGDIHFDDDEDWARNGGLDGMVSFYSVAVHEIGHALGLKHSDNPHAIMAPFYRTFVGDGLHLHQDDIDGVQLLYGEKKNNMSRKLNAPDATSTVAKVIGAQMSEGPRICDDPSIDSITRIANGTIYAFKDKWFWRVLDEGGVGEDDPRLIEDHWPFPAYIDEIFTDTDGDSYIFKGKQYWLMNSTGHLLDNYPSLISHGLVDMPNDMDAALVWHGDDRPYFFKGKFFWRYRSGGMGDRWPRRISRLFKGNSVHIRAAMRFSHSESFLFSKDGYYKLRGKEFSVVTEGYPRSIADYWFGCDNRRHVHK